MKEEKIIVGKDTDYPLNGLLCLPEKTEEHVPAAVFVHGSGASDMNEHVGKLYPFKDLAEGLAAKGIASVRYDKRTFAHGRKMMKEKRPITVYEETIEDALRAAQLLRNDPRIDPSKIFIIGHSMGAMLAPRIDAEGGDFRGIIMMAGVPFRLEEVMMRQFDEIAEQSNRLVAAVVRKQAEKIRNETAGIYEMDIEETKKKKIGNGATAYYFRDIGDHLPQTYLNNSEKPVLIMQGDKDFQVRADIDYAAFKELLKDRDNVTLRLYPGLNHLFVTSVYGQISKANKEYSVSSHIPQDVINDIASWIFSV